MDESQINDSGEQRSDYGNSVNTYEHSGSGEEYLNDPPQNGALFNHIVFDMLKKKGYVNYERKRHSRD